MGITTIRSPSGQISAYINGVALVVSDDHPAYHKIQAALRVGDGDEALRLADVKTAIEDYIANPQNPDAGVKIVNGKFYYKGLEIKTALSNRILEFAAKGHPYQTLVLFFENLMQNPSGHSVRQLFQFLENKKLPFTDDGCFYAYKAITRDWKDCHTQKVDNSIGAKPFMERNEADDDFSEDCGSGFHVGNIDFVRTFAPDGRIVLVKINPKDVVSVPKSETYKLRCNTYEVIEEISRESLGLDRPLYTGSAPVSEVESDDDEYDDDEDDSWVEDEDEEEVDESDDESPDEAELPQVLSLWCEIHGLRKDDFSNHFTDDDIRKAWEDEDGKAFVTALYYRAVEDDDAQLKEVMSNKQHIKQLVRLVQGDR